jgi:hypothetical protein
LSRWRIWLVGENIMIDKNVFGLVVDVSREILAPRKLDSLRPSHGNESFIEVNVFRINYFYFQHGFASRN